MRSEYGGLKGSGRRSCYSVLHSARRARALQAGLWILRAQQSGAKITLRSQDARNARTTLVNDAGQFSFQGVPPGFYEIEAVARGFRLSLKFIRVPEEGDVRIPAIALQAPE